jgi:hypothetical protein
MIIVAVAVAPRVNVFAASAAAVIAYIIVIIGIVHSRFLCWNLGISS